MKISTLRLEPAVNMAMPVVTRIFCLSAIMILGLLNPGPSQAQTITTVAGNGIYDYGGDGGPATVASLRGPSGVTVDGAGNLYIADVENYRIRKVTPSGVISTIAGNGSPYYAGDGGPAIAASFVPGFLAFDAKGNLYFSDWPSFRIRKITPAGVITTVAGNGNGGFSGDGGQATSATLTYPFGVAVDAGGNLYIADSFNNRIRKVSRNGIISTVAGNGVQGFSGDGGPAISASLNQPNGISVDGTGNLYIADLVNNRIRKVNSNGIISTVAGNGVQGFGGDGGPATSANLAGPNDVGLDNNGNLYIADARNSRIRIVNSSGIINTFAGNGTYGFSGDGGPAINAQLSLPDGLSTIGGNLHIADYADNRVRKIALDARCCGPGRCCRGSRP